MPRALTSARRCRPKDLGWTTKPISTASSSGGSCHGKHEGGGSRSCRHPREPAGRLAHSMALGVVVVGGPGCPEAVALDVVVLGAPGCPEAVCFAFLGLAPA